MKSKNSNARFLKAAAAVIILVCVCAAGAKYLKRTGVFAGFGNAEQIPILTYHKITSDEAKEKFYSETSLVIGETQFREQMDWLKERGYKTLTMDEFYSWYKGETEVDKKTVLVTMDDGYYDCYYYAYPILKENRQNATIFCIGARIKDKTPEFELSLVDRHIGRDVIDKVRREYPGFEFESHTYNLHGRLDERPVVEKLPYDKIMDDIKKNSQFGFRYIAYPFGARSDALVKAMKDDGSLKIGFGYNYDDVYAERSSDPYLIPRRKIGANTSFRRFKRYVTDHR